jgi:hypothetical protein
MKTSLDSRIALDKLSGLEKELKSGQYHSTKDLAARHGIGRTTINYIRQLLRERPDLADAVFADQLAPYKAIEFLRKDIHEIPKSPTRRNGDQALPALGDMLGDAKLHNDLLAWCTLTRELLDSIENALLAK